MRGLRLAALLGCFQFPASQFQDAPARDLRVEHFQGAAAGIDLIVMGEIGEAFEDAEQLLVPEASPDLDIAGAALRLNGPNRVSLSPLSGADVTVKALSARTR